MIEWVKLGNGNFQWTCDDRKIRCVVYKKKGTKSSWRWIVTINEVVQQLRGGARAYTWPTANKAKAEIENALALMSEGISWEDATN